MLQIGSGEATRHGSATVRRLQRGLHHAGYAPGPIDGRYGPLTAAAVERFQANHGLQVDGIVGPQTHQALVAAPLLTLGAGESSAHGSPAVARLQRRLVRAGFHPGPVDGRLGTRTEHAVVAFQRARHLAVDGIVGAVTERALYQWSTSAGSAAPHGSRHRTAPRPAPIRHARHPRPEPTPRPADVSAPMTPQLPMMWILIALGALGIIAVLASYYQRPVLARAGRFTDALGAMWNSGPAPRPAAEPVPEPAPVTFVLYEDNSGGYYWTIVGEHGAVLARSAGFATYEEANEAAEMVYRGAATASFENRSNPAPPADLPVPRATQGPPGRAQVQPGRPPTDSTGRAAPPDGSPPARWSTSSRPWPSGVAITPGGRRR